MPDKLVPSPMHRALRDLYTDLHKDSMTIADSLSRACRLMGSGTAWCGPVATAWMADLDGRSRNLTAQMDATVEVVRRALESKSPMVSPEEARHERAALSGSLLR